MVRTIHPLPFIYDETDFKSLHFQISELQSRMRISQPNGLDVDYTRTMMGFLLLNRRPEHIAMIGLGGGSLAKFCRQHLPSTRFIAVEINPHIIALREEFFIPPDDDFFQILQADGADFVQATNGSLDVLLVDGFDHQGQSAQLTSLKFYEACKSALAEGGVLTINFHESHPLYEQFIDRLDRSFDGNFVEVQVNEEGNVIVFASRDLTLSPDKLRRDIQAASADWPAWMAANG